MARTFDQWIVPSNVEIALGIAQVQKVTLECREARGCACKGQCPYDAHPSQKKGK